MPCRDWDEEISSVQQEREKNFKTDIQRLQNKVHLLTQLLCEACNLLTKKNLKSEMSKELLEWWWMHSKEDRKR